jgi:hypothetical protein
MAKKTKGGDPADLIRMAISSIDEQIEVLNQQRAQLVGMVSGEPVALGTQRRGRPPGKIAQPGRKKRVVSAKTKAKLKAAAKARWARYRAEKKAAAKAA